MKKCNMESWDSEEALTEAIGAIRGTPTVSFTGKQGAQRAEIDIEARRGETEVVA